MIYFLPVDQLLFPAIEAGRYPYARFQIVRTNPHVAHTKGEIRSDETTLQSWI